MPDALTLAVKDVCPLCTKLPETAFHIQHSVIFYSLNEYRLKDPLYLTFRKLLDIVPYFSPL